MLVFMGAGEVPVYVRWEEVARIELGATGRAVARGDRVGRAD
jgi:hypothetical protein